MEWVAALKHHTREVYPKIEAFYATRPVNRESRLAAARIFDAWVRSLPDSEDADVWEWFDWKGCQYQSGCLYSVVTHFKDMIELDEQGALGKKKLKRLKFLIPQAKIIYSELNVVLNCYHQCDMAFNRSDNPPEAKWHADLAAKIQNLPAYTVLAVLWPHVYPEYLDLTLYLNAFDMRNWPTVPYKAYHTPTMLYDTIIGIVDRRLEILTIIDAEDDDIALIVMPRRTEAFFEIRVTHPSLLMTPALWQTYCTSLQHRDSMEHLRELGGHIEPLTWDEGQGQGVIVRLPWAKSVL